MNQQKKASTPQFRLTTTLTVMFVLQIVSAVSIIWFINYRSGQKAVQDVIIQLRSELTNRIIEKLEAYTQIPLHINRLNTMAVAQNDINISNPKGEYQLWQQMQNHPTLSYIYCGDEQGGFMGVGRLSTQDRSQMAFLFSNRSTQFIRQDFALDKQGNRTAQIGKLNKPYDPRERPWYKAAQASQKEVWSDIYLSFSTQLPTLTASVPVYNRTDGSLMAVCATDFFLSEEMSAFLQDLNIGETGTAFIVERSGKLVATSSKSSMVKGAGEERERLFATESESLDIQGTANYLKDRFGDLNKVKEVTKLEFTLKGEKQYVQVIPFKNNNLDWLIVLTLPESDFMSEIDASQRKTLWFSLAGLGVAIVIGIGLSRLISRPIRRIVQASEQFAQGNLDERVRSSRITEINILSSSFNAMATELKNTLTSLIRSEKRFRSLVSNIPGAIYRCQCDSDWTMQYMSNTIETISGYPAFEFIHNYNRTYVSIIHPDDRDMVEGIIGEAIASHTPFALDYRIIHRDGSIHWVSEQGQVIFDEDENCLYIDGVIFDISDRKKTEEALRITEENYRSIFENALKGIFQSSPQGQYISVNPALARIYGYDSPKDMLNSITNIGAQVYVDPEKRTEFRELIAQQEKVQNFEYRCYCKDGSIIWTQIDARAVKDSDGNLLYYEGIVQNITERKNREANLQKQLEELQIEIDQKKREKDVAMITNDSYFQEMQQEVSKIDLDEFWS